MDEQTFLSVFRRAAVPEVSSAHGSETHASRLRSVSPSSASDFNVLLC